LSYEGSYIRQGTGLFSQVPTAGVKAGNLSASPTLIYDPMTGAANGTGREPFAGNIIPSSRMDPGIQAVLNWESGPIRTS